MIEQAGKYRARATAAALGTSGTGKEQVAVTFSIVDDPGEEITWYGYFTEATEARTIESLRVCGWTSDDLSDLSGIDKNEVVLVVEMDEWDGRTRPKVRWVNAAHGAALKSAMGAGEAQSFAARMRSRIAALDAAAGRKPAPARPAAPKPAAEPKPELGGTQGGDDEIPF